MTPKKKYQGAALTEIKACLECGDTVRGRVDKKFCSDLCRCSYNNRLNSDQTHYVSNVNHTLRKNRRILKELNLTGKSRVPRDRLVRNGFDFNYFTNLHKTKDGAIYYYCYEQGYLPLDTGYYLLIVKQSY